MSSTLSRREREKLQRHNDIITAAEKRFFQQDFDAVSMDLIAADLELSKPTLYLYFKNKESLFFAVVLRGMVILQDVFKSSTEKELLGINKILNLTKGLYEYVQKYGDYYRLNVIARGPRFFNSLQTLNIDGAELYLSIANNLFDCLKESVECGIKDGSLRSELDPLQTTIFLSSAIESTILITPYNLILLAQNESTLEEYQHRSVEVLLQGIAKGNKSDKEGKTLGKSNKNNRKSI